MNFHRRRAATNEKRETMNSYDDRPMFNVEVHQIHRELKNDLEQLKLENKINQHITKLLELRLMKLKKDID
jgi:hypothetical protein